MTSDKPAPTTPQLTSDDALQLIAKMMQQSAEATKRQLLPSELFVGIRNISSETIGLPAQFDEPEVILHAARPGVLDPNTVAVINYPRWQGLRRSRIYGNGLLVRDDAVLGEVHTTAPADAPRDLHPDHEKNAVPDPHQWITSRDDEQLRAGIDAITSEPSLRRLWAAVDAKVREIMVKVDKTDAKAVKKALQQLPSRYQLVDRLVPDRLEELDPLPRGDEQSEVFATERRSLGRLTRL